MAIRLSAPCSRPIAETLEDRILHSADLAPFAVAGASGDAFTQQLLHPGAETTSVMRSEIVFVDAGLPDADALLSDLRAQQGAGRAIEVVRLAADQDGVALISATLADRHDIAAVHVLAHGDAGLLQLGAARLDSQVLLQRAGEIAAWSSAFTADADLLVYGCDVAREPAGRQFVQDLAALTGADVAASTDLTGAAARGGNWSLEHSVGDIDTVLAPSVSEQLRWKGLLATYTVTSTADVVGATLLPGTLRWAVGQANANAGTDTIVFTVNGTFTLAGLLTGDDSNAQGDLDVNGGLNLVGNGTGNTIVNGNDDRVFDLRSGTTTLSGLTIQGGSSNSGAGLRIDSSATVTLDNVIVQNNLGNGSSKGAGIYNDGPLTLRNVIVQNNGNASNETDGAGIYNHDNGVLDARNVEIRNNIAFNKDGGGLYLKNKGTSVLLNVTLADNQAKRGGGLWNGKGATTLTNVTLSGNSASSEGGGLWSEEQITLDHVTVANNSAPAGKGGGVHGKSGGDDVRVGNSLFVGNVGGNTNAALTSLGHNLSDDTSAGFNATGDLKNVSAGLLPLAYNGGFTRTHAIGPGSVAANAANPTTTLTADQRGIAYFGGRADIGAYEYNANGTAPTISAIGPQSINEDVALGPLVFTVGDFDTAPGSLVVSATSSNSALVPAANIVIAGAGASRTVSLTPAPNANSTANGGAATITLSVSDGVNITTTSFNVTVVAANDAPTVSMPAAQSVNEDAVLTLSGPNAPSVNDVDAGSASLQVTLAVAQGLLTLSQTTGLSFVSGSGSNNASMTFVGSRSAINAALSGLQYRPAVQYSGPDQLTLTVNDLGNSGAGGAASASGTLAITVAAVNDAPTLALPGLQATPQPTPLAFSAGNGNTIAVFDSDAAGATLEVTLRTDGIGNGTLSFGSQAGLTLVSAGSWTNETAIVFRGNQADINAALQTLTFTATGAGAARIDIGVDDLGNSGSGGAGQTFGAVTISVVNDALPVLTLSQTTLNVAEGSPAMALDPGLTIGDADHATLASAIIRIGSGHAIGEDVLAFSSDALTMGNIAGTYSNGVLVLSSAAQTATLAQWQAALRSVTYLNLSEAPSTAARTLTMTVHDGVADSAARFITINVAAVNDAPVLAGANDLANLDEDTASNDGTLVSTLVAGQITDVDAAPAVGIAVTGVDNSNGSWQFTLDGGATWASFGVVSDGAARLLGTDLDTAVRFVPRADWNGAVTAGLTFRAWDQSVGTLGGTADASMNGNTTAFSLASAGSDLTVSPLDDAPVLAGVLVDPSATQGVPFSFGVPAGTFTDVDAGDLLTYSARLASGAALPGWLSFDAATQTFSGTPGNADVGAISIRLTAADSAAEQVDAEFSVRVANVNDAPLLDSAIGGATATQGIAFVFALPDDTFIDPDSGDTLGYAAALGSGAALPGWLTFDAATRTFSGTPAQADVGALVVRVTATDGAHASVSSDFTLTVANVNDAPVASTPLGRQTATQDTAFRFALPAGAFTDADIGDVPSYSASVPSGTAWPAWLRFDAATQVFSGTPGNADVGRWVIRVTAADASGAMASADLELTVANRNDAPVQGSALDSPVATQDVAYVFAMPAGTFVDPDVGDVLSYRVALPTGAPLPAWLQFDGATQTFRGTPGNADVGEITVRVNATDTGGASVSGDFVLTVVNVNDAPRLDTPMEGRGIQAGTTTSFQVPAATFSDPDAGDALHYAAALADGSALPPWLRFDAATRTFIGQPALADLGRIVLRVTAADDAGATAQMLLALDVAQAEVPAAAGDAYTSASAPSLPEPTMADATGSPAVAPAPQAVFRAQAGVTFDPTAGHAGSVAAASTEPAAVLEPALAVQAQRRGQGDVAPGTRPQNRGGDAVLASAPVEPFGEITLAPMMQVLRDADTLRRLEELQRQWLEQGEERRGVIASTIAVTSGLSIGYVAWLVRGGVLVSSMLSALPAWQMIDPLPVLAAAGAAKGRRQDTTGDDVERLFDDRPDDLPRPPAPPQAPIGTPEALVSEPRR